jgi:hypothetical protein
VPARLLNVFPRWQWATILMSLQHRARTLLVVNVLVLCISGCSKSASPPSPTPSAGSGGIPTHAHTESLEDRAVLALGYTADSHLSESISHGPMLRLVHAVCTGSADGHCQAVFAFKGNARRPFWQHEYAGVLSLRTVPYGFVVRAVNYAPHDPLCCPSLPPVQDSFTWNGHGLTEQGPHPGAPRS